jgi:hypothetical protein
MVESTLNYLAPMSERPFFYRYEPPPGTPWRNTKGDRRRVEIENARPFAGELSLDEQGFALASQVTVGSDLFDETTLRAVYYPEVEALVQRVTGAARVLAFDHNIRSKARASRGDAGVLEPVRYPHNDYTESSGPQRVRDLLDTREADARLRGRFAVVNVWKPIGRPVEEAPLAVCHARSIRPEDLIATDLIYQDRRGEIYSLVWSATHRWFYFPHMRPDEALLLKCYDSDRTGAARFTAHSAFDDPSSPPDASTRESVEVRTLAFF